MINELRTSYFSIQASYNFIICLLALYIYININIATNTSKQRIIIIMQPIIVDAWMDCCEIVNAQNKSQLAKLVNSQ